MPSGKTHEKINITVLVVILTGLYYLSTRQETAIVFRYLDIYKILTFSVSYLFATFFLSPDLDTKSRPYKRWKMLRILWWPYRIIFKHRGFSHNMFLGPLTILLNLALITFALLLFTGIELRSIPPRFAVAFIAGMILPIEVHIISDILVPKIKFAVKKLG
ncbi:metal-binding protein [Methanomethylovorans sp.]|uniref:metal-binding protein n=1 Tax=Methanomethylovorans sp. TaxID=2758717 RepID=UPI00351C2A0E